MKTDMERAEVLDRGFFLSQFSQAISLPTSLKVFNLKAGTPFHCEKRSLWRPPESPEPTQVHGT